MHEQEQSQVKRRGSSRHFFQHYQVQCNFLLNADFIPFPSKRSHLDNKPYIINSQLIYLITNNINMK